MQVVVFTLGSEKFALETRIVHGIEKMMTITRVPTAPYYIKGLANLRGSIISVINLKSYLNMDNINEEDNIIIIELGEEKVGIMVDNVHEVVDISHDMIERVNDASSYIKGVINFQDSVVTLLEGEMLLEQ
ncbi:chemotaxis protein CheW [Clostridium cylindrosporum]|uniref:Chemotaxis protein CheW n=1 Tax=Clostridium cylindrosporum DSM 605 TaxID=1121307 RepID=A0A0J8D722_CLOCY|nr:chemotaxis protein CheW [Clostridium cylindrosporum]KMT21682.1 chemotaxis protein CheW [Clostridium cylindrosporum DSM 605]